MGIQAGRRGHICDNLFTKCLKRQTDLDESQTLPLTNIYNDRTLSGGFNSSRFGVQVGHESGTASDGHRRRRLSRVEDCFDAACRRLLSPEFFAERISGAKAQGVVCLRGDLADLQAVSKAFQNADVVFHVAAKAGIWGDYSEYYAANVIGTRNVIEACLRNGIAKLVYTSTPSVAFGGHDVRNANEEEPFPKGIWRRISRQKPPPSGW